MKIDKSNELQKKLKIIVVESSIELRSFYAGAIKKSEFFEVQTAANHTDALQILSGDYDAYHFILFNWQSSSIPISIFIQNIRRNFNYDHIELIAFAQNLNEEDAFLFSELEIHYTIPKIMNGAQLLKKLEEIRNDYHFFHPVLRKINELKHCIHIEDLEKCEEIIKDPKIQQKILHNHKFLYLHGEILILQKKYTEAIKFFEDILKDRSRINQIETLRTMSALGKAYCLAGKNNEALMIYEKLEAKSPRNLNHKIMVGEALLGLEETYKAEAKFHEILDKVPKDKQALTGMVKSNSIAGKYDLARSFFDQIEGDFESKSLASYFNNRGVLLIKKNNFNEAVAFYKNALYFFKKHRGLISFNLGMAYYRNHNIEAAAEFFEDAIKTLDDQQISQKVLLKAFKEEGAVNFIAKYKLKKVG
ncbi:tetratricopeptide repeat protein [Pigmentibacter sp. JX0631]|uniref:tetratricopeptide repeat protein n=1 Tax=Pigmentibacter sp. JX0631 TaxID=2976982 RepID=UPI00246900CA|nr:tetratricopeptide repeat protein [Pigmentibacter sp. JX0631]WGL60651.1 tetratricopeptide repeat protein [Pigmentibacter sp. JX0631]